jgi:hypothetical protein
VLHPTSLQLLPMQLLPMQLLPMLVGIATIGSSISIRRTASPAGTTLTTLTTLTFLRHRCDWRHDAIAATTRHVTVVHHLPG